MLLCVFFSPLTFNLSLVAKVENRGIGSKRMCTHGDPIHGHADGFGLFKLFIGGDNMPRQGRRKLLASKHGRKQCRFQIITKSAPQDIRCLGEKI